MSAGHRRWTKLQSVIESRFADSLHRRLRVRCVGYRGAHDGDGRAYFELDGEEIGNFCNLSAMWHAGGRHNPLCHDPDANLQWSFPQSSPPAEPHRKGEFSQEDFIESCLTYRDLSIDDALTSPNPLHLALAVVDRRCGKRRLEQIDPKSLPPIAAHLLRVRLSASSPSKRAENQ